MATNKQTLENLNTHCNALVLAIAQLNVYTEDWSSLPGAVKTSIKNKLVSVLNAHIANIEQDITDINSL